MKHNAVVLGCGLVGATMARDMASDPEFNVVIADLNPENLRKLESVPNLIRKQEDVSEAKKLRTLIADADVVLGALPSRFGLQTLRTVLECRKPYADISFMAEDAMELDSLAKEKGISAVVDCGVSPGLSNLMIGRSVAEFDETRRAEIYVGGLPKARRWPFQYKAPFAPHDVIEEYTRPARLVENGRVVVKAALSEPELIDFPRVGTLEAFNTDGLRSLLKTVMVPDMKEKTLRYPGHAELMRVFRETGLFSQETIDVRGARIVPREVTSRLLFPLWAKEEGEQEFTVLRVIVEGAKSAESFRHTYDLYDETDAKTGTSSMARTTAFPCAIVARMLARRMITEPGVFPPELLANNSIFFDHILDALHHRGVHIARKSEKA